MAYPADGAPKAELLINGVWTDISSSVRAESGITIRRGRADEQSRLAPQSADFTLDDRDGRFSNRNPLSPYYGLLPRNTQCRITAGTGDTYLRLPTDLINDASNRCSAADAAALDVVGDIEVRMDLQPYSWRPNYSMVLMSKYVLSGNQRSWAVYLDQAGYLAFVWSSDGTSAGRISVISTAPIPVTAGRLSLKVTLDVVNGASKTNEFWTAPSIDGTYTKLGTTVTTATNTSIFNSTAPLVFGQGGDNVGIFTGFKAFRGRFHKARLYNGIGGTVVANPDVTVQALRASSFVDSAGITWNVVGTARITSDRVRMWGELSSLPVSSDKTQRDIYSTATVSGITRRLTQGASPLESPLYRSLSGRSLTGYWPMEDGSRATAASSAVTGSRAATATKVQFSDTVTLPGASTSASFIDAGGRFIGVPKATANTGTAYFTYYLNLPSIPATQSTFVKLSTSGTARTILLGVTATAFTFDFYNSEGVSLFSTPVGFGGSDFTPLGKWIAFNMLMTTSGGNVNVAVTWSNVLGESFVTYGGISYTGSVGRITTVDISAAASASFTDASIAHIHTATNNLTFVSSSLARASNAYNLEAAGTRLQRLCSEENVLLEVTGDPADTEPMGYQGVDTFMSLVYECADADIGMLGEARDALALTYRTRVDMDHARDVALVMTNLFEVPPSVEDDYGIRNDVTVSQPSGGSGRREITTGNLSVSAPPAGIGRYVSDVTLNIGSATRLVDVASWIANLGSWDGARYPSLTIAMHRSIISGNALLLAAIYGLDLGDTAGLSGFGAWLPPEEVLLLNQGYTEKLSKFLWDISFNTSPAGLLNTGRYDIETVITRSRYDHSTATTNATMTSGSTTLVSNANSSTPTTLDLWTSLSGSYPFDVMVAGERMTLTAAPVTVGQIQTFSGVTRNVNGKAKAHAVGERIRIYLPVYYQL